MWIIHDFAYADLCFEQYRAPSLLQVAGAKDLGVEFYSLSKGYGLAGWRVGFCVGNPALVQALKKIKSYLDFGLFQPLQIGAIAALQGGEPRELVAEYESRRDVLVRGLQDMKWEVEAPRATLFVWARLPESITEGSHDWSARLLESEGVAVCPGYGFDVHAGRYVRFALVEPENRIRRALTLIEKVCS